MVVGKGRRKSVSIIIPNLNSPVVDQTLASLRSQTFDLDQVEVLVVGQDKLQFVVEDELVRFIPTDRPVIQSIARNIGVDKAQGNILIFIDADCIADQDWLQVFVDCFQDENVQLVGGGLIFPRDEYWTLCDNVAILHKWLSTRPPGTYSNLASLNMAIRRATWERIGGFDASYIKAEDTELSIRARLAGYKLYFEPRAIITHRPDPSRNRLRQVLRRSFESGYWTVRVLTHYQDEIGLAPYYRRLGLMLLLAPLTAVGITIKIFLMRGVHRFWYTFPIVYINKLLWRIGGAYWLWESRKRSGG